MAQFATILHLLQQGCPMLEYEALMFLYDFVVVPKNNKKHWSDNFKWTMVEFMHEEVMWATRVAIGVVQYVAMSRNEVFTFDN
jgi:hypothetical protein